MSDLKVNTVKTDAITNQAGSFSIATIAMTNTPAFQARNLNAFQFSDNTDTKVTGFTEDFDTDNNFASDRFTPTTAGKYFVNITGSIQSTTNYDMYNGNISIYKNGSRLLKTSSQGHSSSKSHRYGLSLSLVVDMNGSSDYLEMYVYLNTVTNGDARFEADTISFGAYKLIGV